MEATMSHGASAPQHNFGCLKTKQRESGVRDGELYMLDHRLYYFPPDPSLLTPDRSNSSSLQTPACPFSQTGLPAELLYVCLASGNNNPMSTAGSIMGHVGDSHRQAMLVGLPERLTSEKHITYATHNALDKNELRRIRPYTKITMIGKDTSSRTVFNVPIFSDRIIRCHYRCNPGRGWVDPSAFVHVNMRGEGAHPASLWNCRTVSLGTSCDDVQSLHRPRFSGSSPILENIASSSWHSL